MNNLRVKLILKWKLATFLRCQQSEEVPTLFFSPKLRQLLLSFQRKCSFAGVKKKRKERDRERKSLFVGHAFLATEGGEAHFYHAAREFLLLQHQTEQEHNTIVQGWKQERVALLSPYAGLYYRTQPLLPFSSAVSREANRRIKLRSSVKLKSTNYLCVRCAPDH